MLYLLLLAVSACSPEASEQAGLSETSVVEEEVIEVDEIPTPEGRTCIVSEVGREVLSSLPDEWDLNESDVLEPSTGICHLHRRIDDFETDQAIEELSELSEAIVAMQPAFSRGWEGGYKRAVEIAWDINEGVVTHGWKTCQGLDTGQFTKESERVPRVNNFVIASLGRRESGFLRVTEQGYSTKNKQKITNCRWCRGSAGEMGMFQLMPKGFILRTFLPRTCSPFDRRCSIQAAIRALMHIRCMCIDQYGDECTMSTYVAGYGLTKLPSPEKADQARGVPEAREYLCSARSDCDELWPLSRIPSP